MRSIGCIDASWSNTFMRVSAAAMAVVVGVFAGPAAGTLMRPLAHDGSERVNVLLSPHYCPHCPRCPHCLGLGTHSQSEFSECTAGNAARRSSVAEVCAACSRGMCGH